MRTIPRIHGLVVSVGYASDLYIGMLRWVKGLASLTVVTTPEDRATLSLCQAIGGYITDTPVRVHTTDAFTRDGAFFNKGLAMEEARQGMPWEDWILFFDADIVPQYHWERSLPELQMGYLYGCWRLQAESRDRLDDTFCPQIPDDRPGYGYFQLFHSRDPKVQRRPLLDTHWTHAGNADSNFLLSFRSMTRVLPLRLWHLGTPHENWFGKGRAEDYARMQQTRGGAGIHPSERL